jgi:chlorosome envelope protein X
MKITINDRECNATTGDILLDVARAGHSHIGYFCGGNALCQTCYVKVLEGQELLSPMTSAEKAMLSDTLISEGMRMACQTTIEKPGKISILTTVEEAARLTLSNPAGVPAYMGKMGWAAAEKFTDTISFQARRDIEGHQVSPWELLTDVIGGIGDAIQLVMEAVMSVFTPKPGTADTDAPENGKSHASNGATSRPTASCPVDGASKLSHDVLRIETRKGVACN